jgi:hypothetical protein
MCGDTGCFEHQTPDITIEDTDEFRWSAAQYFRESLGCDAL